MKRVTLEEARKLFDLGVVIYLLPSRTEYVPGIKISVCTHKLKDKDFEDFVKNYKAVSSNKMRYYVDEKEVEVAAKIREKRTGKPVNVGKSVRESKIDGLPYTKNDLMRIGSNVVSLWGGKCYKFEIDKSAKKVIFFCVEHGERFGTDVAFSELNAYDY